MQSSIGYNFEIYFFFQGRLVLQEKKWNLFFVSFLKAYASRFSIQRGKVAPLQPNIHADEKNIKFSLIWPHWADSVIESICPSVRVSLRSCVRGCAPLGAVYF